MNDVLNKSVSDLDYIMHDDEPDYAYMACLCNAEDFFEHHGIKGMHWGIRRSLQELGYNVGKKRQKRRAEQLKVKKRKLKMKMKDIELSQKEKELKEKAKAAKKPALRKIEEDSKSSKDAPEKGSIEEIASRKGGAQLLAKRMKDLSTAEIREANSRFAAEKALRDYASAEKAKGSRTQKLRDTAKQYREIVSDIKSTKESFETMKNLISGGKKKVETAGKEKTTKEPSDKKKTLSIDANLASPQLSTPHTPKWEHDPNAIKVTDLMDEHGKIKGTWGPKGVFKGKVYRNVTRQQDRNWEYNKKQFRAYNRTVKRNTKLSNKANVRANNTARMTAVMDSANTYISNKRNYKLKSYNNKTARKTINRGMSVIEKYAAVDITTKALDTAYKYSMDPGKYEKMIKRMARF